MVVTRASMGGDEPLKDWDGEEMSYRTNPYANRGKPPDPGPRSKLLWIGVDLDGTLAQPIWTPENPTSEIGDPIWENVEKLRAAVKAGYKPIIHTARPWTDYERIEGWLSHYSIPYKEIQCGKPLYAAYIDDRAINADDESWLPR